MPLNRPRLLIKTLVHSYRFIFTAIVGSLTHHLTPACHSKYDLGTGKTLLGVCLGKLILSSTRQKILCLCPTDNSLDSLLGGMHDAGVTSMVSLNGDTNNAKLAPYQLENPPARDFSKAQTRQLAQLKKDLDTSRSAIAQVQHTSKLNVKPETSEVVKWLRRHRPQVFQELLEAKVVGDSSDPDVDMEVSREQGG